MVTEGISLEPRGGFVKDKQSGRSLRWREYFIVTTDSWESGAPFQFVLSDWIF